jgi:hypothetical protein
VVKDFGFRIFDLGWRGFSEAQSVPKLKEIVGFGLLI